jgi:hypothetical protein
MCAYRQALSRIKRVEDVAWQRIIEVVTNDEFSDGASRHTTARRRFQRDDLRHRLAGLGDNQLFAAADFFQ